MEEKEDFDVYRFIVTNIIDEIIDDEVINLLEITKNNKLKQYKKIKYYGRYLLRERRDW